MTKRLHRVEANRMLFGVCSGLAKYLDADVTLVRIAFVALALATGGAGVLFYLALAFIMPTEASLEKPTSDVLRENTQDMASTVRALGQDIRTGFASRGEAVVVDESPAEESERAEWRRSIAAVILIVIGALLLLSNLQLLWWVNWAYLWPVALIIVGVFIMTARRT